MKTKTKKQIFIVIIGLTGTVLIIVSVGRIAAVGIWLMFWANNIERRMEFVEFIEGLIKSEFVERK